MVTDNPPHFGRLMELARAFQNSKVFLVACDLGVFNYLSFPATAADLAARLQVDARALNLLLNGLAALGLVTKAGEAFRNSPTAEEYLVAGRDNYRGAIFKHLHHTWPGWSDLEPVVITGGPRQTAPERWLDANEEARQEEVSDFIWGMHAIARDTLPLVLKQLDLTGATHVLDLGGGPATYAIGFVQHYPGLKATVFDLPLPLTIARENISSHGLQERIDTRAGNFLTDDIGRGYDYIWVSQILHSHTEEQCQLLLAKATAALEPGGRLAVHDFFLNDDGYTPPSAAMFGVHMLAVTPGGRAYTHTETAAWMRETGVQSPELRRVNEHSAILVGVKP